MNSHYLPGRSFIIFSVTALKGSLKAINNSVVLFAWSLPFNFFPRNIYNQIITLHFQTSNCKISPKNSFKILGEAHFTHKTKNNKNHNKTLTERRQLKTWWLSDKVLENQVVSSYCGPFTSCCSELNELGTSRVGGREDDSLYVCVCGRTPYLSQDYSDWVVCRLPIPFCRGECLKHLFFEKKKKFFFLCLGETQKRERRKIKRES